uniref:G-protein coupled receptors family 1 profile domain-containing protein n=1 Tax=Pan paniscus TaxID=9597 RepID=A0A2R9BLJ0_PANPA
MPAKNSSSVTEFILSGLTDQPGLQIPPFFLFLGLTSHLHIPMYFFPFNLSFIDFSYSTTLAPKMLMSFVSENIISYAGCMTQLFFFCFFVFSESYILSDRYVGICNPLLYTVTMSPQMCLLLLLDNLVNHYMCDILPLLELSCNSSYINLLVVFIIVTVGIGVPIVTIFLSYGFILSSILHISSTEGRSKAFSTCSSHIIVVSLFFGSGAFMYLKPPSILPLDQGKVSSIFCTAVVPMFNPLIYSLRNKDVKVALRRTFCRKLVS